MIPSLFSPDFVEQTSLPSGKLGEAILAFQNDLHTGLMDLDIPGETGHILLFARGKLVNIYSKADVPVRLDHEKWQPSMIQPAAKVFLRTLALTPQDVRIFKILIEQQADTRFVIKNSQGIEAQFVEWIQHPVPALVQVCWPKAEALVSFPGLGAEPYYTLFINSNQILHSAGGLTEIYAWKEPYLSLSLYSSEPGSLAWTEYLLHLAFSSLVGTLLGKFEKLIGRILLNQIIRDVNFKATAHDWNLSINAFSVNDQTIFSSPAEAADVYSRLLEMIFRHFETVLGGSMLEMLVREAITRLPLPARAVVKDYLPVVSSIS